MSRSRRTILDLALEFFDSPLWNDTIKDFVLENCYMFTGEEEYCHAHNECHKRFCEIIENTLNIYLLEVIGISFEKFQKICVETSQDPKSIGRKILSILLQAIDFKYFAAKMYAFNLMLDRQVAVSFIVEGETPDAFFVTNGDLGIEIKDVDAQVQAVQESIAKIEAEEFGVAPLAPEEPIHVLIPQVAPVKLEPMAPAPVTTSLPPLIKPKAAPIKSDTDFDESEVVADTTPAPMNSPIQSPVKKVPETPVQEAIQERKKEIVQQMRVKCHENIELNLKKREKEAIQPEEDPNAAIRRALASRVKAIITSN